MKLRFLAFALSAGGCATIGSVPLASEQEAFWRSLTALCGQAFVGRVVHSSGSAGDTSMASQRLVMHVRECSDEEIRVPFHVGEDRSREWVFTRTTTGLRLKHDHRHADGQSDSVTMYGGDTRGAGESWRQSFPADAHTVSINTLYRTNVWTVELRPGQSYVYDLQRIGTDRRFRVEFDLTRPVAAPPPPWRVQ